MKVKVSQVKAFSLALLCPSMKTNPLKNNKVIHVQMKVGKIGKKAKI